MENPNKKQKNQKTKSKKVKIHQQPTKPFVKNTKDIKNSNKKRERKNKVAKKDTKSKQTNINTIKNERKDLKSTKQDEEMISVNEIDEFLDEIEDRQEEKDEIDIEWNQIVTELKTKNFNFIKNLITSKQIGINQQNPLNGKTILIYAVIIGSLELVTAICNFGADVKIKDDDALDALDYAMRYGRLEITHLIFYRTLSGTLGADLKRIQKEQARQIEEAEYILKVDPYGLPDKLISLMVQAIRERAPFDETMLFYAWYFILKKAEEQNKNPFEMKSHYGQKPGLWETMMETYENILSNTSDKNGWQWLKTRFINSYIWYLPKPNYKENEKKEEYDDDDDDNEHNKMEKILENTLFYELLVRVRKESKKQSDILLKEKIDKIKKEKPNEWNELISYNVNTKYSKVARQDKVGSFIPKYKENELSEDIYPSSNHFSAKKFYDTSIFLNEILFRGNILDDMFQKQMKKITKEINKQTGYDVTYKAGPVKTLTRSQAKVENDYINEDWPTSAKILDINRCSLDFTNIEEMMKYLQLFTHKIKNKKAGIIKEIIRVKNGWSVYNEEYPQYTDIKLNALIVSPKDGSVIVEIQFLLKVMSNFKKKSHKLYAIERKWELVYNFGLLKQRMSQFKDYQNLNDVLCPLAINDDIKFFKLLCENIEPDKNSLIRKNREWNDASKIFNHTITNIIAAPTSKIHYYLLSNYNHLYQSTFFNCFDDKKVSLFQAICKYGDLQLVGFLLDSDIFDDKQKYKALTDKSFHFGNDKNVILHILQYVQNDRKALSKILWNENNKNQQIHFNPIVVVISSINKIHDHLQTYFKDVYCKTILFWMKYYAEKGYSVLHDIIFSTDINDKTDIIDEYRFIQILFHLIDDDIQLKQLLFCQNNGGTLFGEFCGHANIKNIETLKYILLNQRLHDEDKIKCLINQRPRCNQLPILMKEQDNINKNTLSRFAAIWNLFNLNASKLVFEHKAFNYTTFKTCEYNESVNNKYLQDTKYRFIDDTFKGGPVFVFGEDFYQCGILGLGDDYDKNECRTPRNMDIFNNNNLLEISTCVTHTLAIDINGNIWCWGSNSKGQLGEEVTEKNRIKTAPHLLPSFCKYKAIHVAVSFGKSSMILTEDGNVWVCGNGNSQIVQVEALKDYDIVQIAASSCHEPHYCAISINGKLFTWGDNEHGKCGFKWKLNDEDIKTPTLVDLNGLMASYVACGHYHTVVLTTDGTVLSFGNGADGVLGDGADGWDQYEPKIIEAISSKRVIDIACGSFHSLCVTEDGQLYSWGAGNSGMGHGDEEHQYRPKKVEFDNENIKIVSCEAGDTYSGVITATGDLYMFGDNERYQLGLGSGSKKEIYIPTKVEYFNNKRVAAICLGKWHSLVVTKKEEDDNKTDGEEKEKDNDIIIHMKGQNQVKHIENKMKKNMNSKSFKMYIQNEKLFGCKDWILINGNKKYCPFPKYISIMDNFQFNDNQQIELVNTDKIDEIYHNEILETQYVLLFNENKQLINEEMISQDKIIQFQHLKDIKFTIPKSNNNHHKPLSLYVKPPNSTHFFSVKQFKNIK